MGAYPYSGRNTNRNSIFNVMSEQDILDYVMNQVESVKQGKQSALDIYPKLNELKRSIDELRKELYDPFIDELDNYNKREDVVRNGYELSVQRRMYPKYNQDDEYSFINKKLKARKSLIKEATEKGRTLTDSETGESVDPVEASYKAFPVCKWVGQEVH